MRDILSEIDIMLPFQGAFPFINIRTQGVATLALGYVVLAFQAARRSKLR